MSAIVNAMSAITTTLGRFIGLQPSHQAPTCAPSGISSADERHKRTVPSAEAETMCSPFDETSHTLPVWPSRT